MAAFQQGTLHMKGKSSVATADSGWIRVYAKLDGNLYIKNSTGTEDRFVTSTEVASISASLNTRISATGKKTIGFTVDGGGAPPAVGTYTSIVSPFSGTITSWTIVADISGSVILDVWKANNVKPTNANSITDANKPTLSSQDFATSTNLTNWTTSVAIGDVFTIEVEGISGCNRVTLQLGVIV